MTQPAHALTRNRLYVLDFPIRSVQWPILYRGRLPHRLGLDGDARPETH